MTTRKTPAKSADDGTDSNNDGSATVHIGTAKSGTGSNSNSGSDSTTVGTDGDDSSSGDSGENGSGIDNLPLGLRLDARRNDPYRPKSGKRRGRPRGNSSHSGTAKTSASTTAEEIQEPIRADIPREVEFSDLGKTKEQSRAKVTALTKEFLEEGWTIAFQGAGFLLRDPEWKLGADGDDASELADRSLNWIRSLDPKSSKELEKRIARWQPLLSVLMALIAICWPRIQHTMDRRKNAINIQAKGPRTPASPVFQAAPSVASSDNGTVSATGNDATAGTRRTIYSERPFRREDYGEIFGNDDA